MTNREILKKYPYLHDPGHYSYATKADDTWVDNVPIGWRKRFFQLCDFINQKLEEVNGWEHFHVLQVKEKFGALRMYTAISDGLPKDVVDAILKEIQVCETETSEICMMCGAPAKYLSKGWVDPYCEGCAKEYFDSVIDHFSRDNPKFEDSFEPIRKEAEDASE